MREGILNKRNASRAVLYRAYDKEIERYDEHKYPFQKKWHHAFMEYQTNTAIDHQMVWNDIRWFGRIVGFLITYTSSTWRDDAERPYTYILEAYVAPDYRRLGLMRKAVKRALKSQTEYVVLDVFKKNPAYNFWPKLLGEFGYGKDTEYECIGKVSLVRTWYRFKGV